LPDLTMTGTVATVDTFGETVQGLVRFTVRVDLAESDPRLFLSMTANAAIVTDVQENALTVPLDAVQFDDEGEYVNRVNPNGSIERVNIVSGQTDGDLVFVTGDLTPGDQVQIFVPEVEQSLPFGPG
jgi:multidrug efflux pump subunit AcrA (membrane-fusion protein)